MSVGLTRPPEAPRRGSPSRRPTPLIGRVALVGLVGLVAGCGAWDTPAPARWEPPSCPSTPTLLAEVNAHLAQGGLATVNGALSGPSVAADLRALLRVALTQVPPAQRLGAGDKDAADARAPVPDDVAQQALALSAAATVLAALTTTPEGTPARVTAGAPLWPGGASALRAASQCLTPDALRALATVLRDPRADAVLAGLSHAAARSHDAKAAELAEVALAAPTPFAALADTLLRNLADADFDPTTLLDLLDGLSTGEGSLVGALGAAVRLLVTTPSDEVDSVRRAATASLLTCVRTHDTQQATPLVLYALLVRTHLPPAATPAPSAPTTPAPTTPQPAARAAAWTGVADSLDVLAADAEASAALPRLGQALLAPPVGAQALRELHALLTPPHRATWIALVDTLSRGGACGP